MTANPFVLQNPVVQDIARELKRTPEQVVFRFSIQMGILPLTGTTSELHMKEDLQVKEFELNNDDLKMIGIIAA